MKNPKIKDALLCRILPYILVLGGFIAPIVIIAIIPPIPTVAKVIFGVVMAIGLVIYIVKNFTVLMMMDARLAAIRCHQIARKQFEIPEDRNLDRIEKKLSSFGKGYPPVSLLPAPTALRYRLQSSDTTYAKGIEKVVAVYHTDLLDAEAYEAIFHSTEENSTALIGKKKPLLSGKANKEAPLHRVTVAVIFAKSVDTSFAVELYDKICEKEGDNFETAFISCVIDCRRRVCVFNSLCLPYLGFIHSVKNHGVKMIREFVFGGKLPLQNNPYTVPLSEDIKNIDPEQSLWDFWRAIKNEVAQDEQETKQRFDSMTHRQILLDDDLLYIKWEERGLWLCIERDEDAKTVSIDPISFWYYPKNGSIDKKTAEEIERLVRDYFAEAGYTCEFISYED